MKCFIIFLINAVTIVPFAVFYRYGGNVTFYMIPVWFFVSVLNSIYSKDVKGLILYNTFLAAMAVIGIGIDGVLYFCLIFYDKIGESICKVEAVAAVIIIAVITTVEAVIKRHMIGNPRNT